METTHRTVTSPALSDQSPLIPKVRGQGAISNATYIRSIVQLCFDQAIDKLRQDGHLEEADSLGEATVHWLRHTGISDDVKTDPVSMCVMTQGTAQEPLLTVILM